MLRCADSWGFQYFMTESNFVKIVVETPKQMHELGRAFGAICVKASVDTAKNNPVIVSAHGVSGIGKTSFLTGAFSGVFPRKRSPIFHPHAATYKTVGTIRVAHQDLGHKTYKGPLSARTLLFFEHTHFNEVLCCHYVLSVQSINEQEAQLLFLRRRYCHLDSSNRHHNSVMNAAAFLATQFRRRTEAEISEQQELVTKTLPLIGKSPEGTPRIVSILLTADDDASKTAFNGFIDHLKMAERPTAGHLMDHGSWSPSPPV